MKRIFLILLVLSAAFPSNLKAQFSAAGVQLGGGFSTASDELFFNSPILAFDGGAYIQYAFNTDHPTFFLQAGLNLVRLGSRFEMDLPTWNNLRDGYYNAWYLQLPLLMCWRIGLPTQHYPHFAVIKLGPQISYGISGTLHDHSSSTSFSDPLINFDYTVQAFDNHLRRFDAGLHASLGYEIENFTFDVRFHWGIVPNRPVEEILIYLEREQGEDVPTLRDAKGYNGNNIGFTLTLGYRMPIHGYHATSSGKNPFR